MLITPHLPDLAFSGAVVRATGVDVPVPRVVLHDDRSERRAYP
jgi:hypothetical protein